MKLKLIVLGSILSLIIIAIPSGFITQVYADDDEHPIDQEQKIIAPELEEMLAGMSPADNISVIVCLKTDPEVEQQIEAITEGQPDDELHRISESLKQKYRSVSMAMEPFEEQLKAGDPAAIKRHRQLLEEYGITEDYLKAINQRVQEIETAKARQQYSILVQAYSGMQQQAKERIEALPDTRVTSNTFTFNSLTVETKVGNIETIAAIPDVVRIIYNAPLFLSTGIVLLSPADNSVSHPVNQPSFSWTPLGDNTKYRFSLAKDINLTQVVKEAEVIVPAYSYNGTLDYSTQYFWKVQCIEPACDPSPTFGFQTEAAPPPPPEAPPQSKPWSPILIVGLLVAIGAAVGGCIIWFLLFKKYKAKS